MFRAVLFDLDGTLLDTLEDLADSVNAALSSLGFPTHPTEAYRYFVGDGVEVLARRALPPEAAGEEPAVRNLIELQREIYGRRWNLKTRPYDGIVELLEQLDRRGIAKAVLSNKPDAFVGEMMRHYFPRLSFDAAIGARAGVARKPDPEAALQVASALDLPPAAFLYLGDTNTDMQTARAAGMYPVGALWGFRPESELREAGAATLVARPQELLALLGE